MNFAFKFVFYPRGAVCRYSRIRKILKSKTLPVPSFLNMGYSTCIAPCFPSLTLPNHHVCPFQGIERVNYVFILENVQTVIKYHMKLCEIFEIIYKLYGKHHQSKITEEANLKERSECCMGPILTLKLNDSIHCCLWSSCHIVGMLIVFQR